MCAVCPNRASLAGDWDALFCSAAPVPPPEAADVPQNAAKPPFDACVGCAIHLAHNGELSAARQALTRAPSTRWSRFQWPHRQNWCLTTLLVQQVASQLARVPATSASGASPSSYGRHPQAQRRCPRPGRRRLSHIRPTNCASQYPPVSARHPACPAPGLRDVRHVWVGDSTRPPADRGSASLWGAVLAQQRALFLAPPALCTAPAQSPVPRPCPASRPKQPRLPKGMTMPSCWAPSKARKHCSRTQLQGARAWHCSMEALASEAHSTTRLLHTPRHGPTCLAARDPGCALLSQDTSLPRRRRSPCSA